MAEDGRRHGLVQFAFVALVAAPIDRYPWLRFLPASLANDLIRRAAVTNTRLTALPPGALALLVLLAALYLVGGPDSTFSLADRLARSRGVLGVH